MRGGLKPPDESFRVPIFHSITLFYETNPIVIESCILSTSHLKINIGILLPIILFSDFATIKVTIYFFYKNKYFFCNRKENPLKLIRGFSTVRGGLKPPDESFRVPTFNSVTLFCETNPIVIGPCILSTSHLKQI